ncbi:hypothetical protein LTS07_009374 [Exophiala sideris]|uniref:Major facilitator superfamily (MFS) profile domain-containing protein n=1 Tax=Exophiala sideris TaxID=1016849 RepID=A0ABR0IZY9_9EURO|nr:hypothetical protein LTS07_009374 [Exophiala sideris]KAK5028125.1 hypothetical protein LTR13_009113 [Exophiala sideris]KAK5052783.1 hypothetical protein LTR69_009609 [Exophiala sideris]KAK5178394.1 hypothetical protein LTR44_009019 [Eurotiomycetes sp. CCFEE 6388]
MADHAEMQFVDREDLDRVPTADLGITRASWWDNKKMISITIFIYLASLSYSIDTGIINGFQAMPGFLMVFGYPDPALPIGFGITTKIQQHFRLNCWRSPRRSFHYCYTATILNRNAYRIPLAVKFVGPVLLFIGPLFLPEPPHYLCFRNRHEQAYRAPRQLRDASYSDLKVEEELAEVKYAIAMDLQSAEGVRFWHIFRRKNLCRTLTSVATASFNTTDGSHFILQYGVYFFILSGDTHAFRDIVILLTLGLFGTLLTLPWLVWQVPNPHVWLRLFHVRSLHVRPGGWRQHP